MESAPYDRRPCWGLRMCDNTYSIVAHAKTRTRFSKKSPLGATRQNQQILAFAYNNKRVRATATFGMLVVCVESIDYAYLRRNGVKACTRCREEKIRVSICHLPNHPRSSRRRRSTNPPPSGKLIVRYSLFRQGKVRMSSTKGRHLLSP